MPISAILRNAQWLAAATHGLAAPGLPMIAYPWHSKFSKIKVN